MLGKLKSYLKEIYIIRIIKKSGLFDKEYYLKNNLDVARSCMNPIKHYVRHGWKEGRNPNWFFDTKWYLDTYLDVANLGINPLYHYCKLGWREGRNPSSLFDTNWYLQHNPNVAKAGMNPLCHYAKHAATEISNYDVFLVSFSPPLSGTALYRGKFLAEMLSNSGYKVKYLTLLEFHRDYKSILNNKSNKEKFVIISRPDSSHGFLWEFLFRANRTNLHIWADMDDLCFPHYSTYRGCVRSKTYSISTIYENACKDIIFHQTFDGVLVTTELLKKIYSEFRLKTILVPNRISADFLKKPHEKSNQNTLRLLYPSGTPTHLKDFCVAGYAILQFMIAYPDSTITFLGDTTIPSFFQPILNEGRLNKIGRVSFEEMIRIYSEHDVALVPLEDTDFNRAKSNIKFIEAGAVGKPIVASNLPEFSKVIKHGINGFICKNEKDWYETLIYVYENRQILRDIGKQAYITVDKQHTTKNYQNELLKLLECR